MAVQDLNLKNLRQSALVYAGLSDAQNHFGSNVNLWINEGLRKMYGGTDGVEDMYIGTCTIGQRTYTLPPGFLYCKMLMVDNVQLEFRTTNDLDYYAAGNSRPTWYTLWGKPSTQIYLGPQAPDSPYALQIFFYRTPNALLQDTDIPEIPPQWREAPAKWAAAQMAIVDTNYTQAKALMEDFNISKEQFKEWYLDEDKGNFLTVQYLSEY